MRNEAHQTSSSGLFEQLWGHQSSRKTAVQLICMYTDCVFHHAAMLKGEFIFCVSFYGHKHQHLLSCLSPFEQLELREELNVPFSFLKKGLLCVRKVIFRTIEEQYTYICLFLLLFWIYCNLLNFKFCSFIEYKDVRGPWVILSIVVDRCWMRWLGWNVYISTTSCGVGCNCSKPE